MTPAFLVVSAALALLVADGLAFGRENEDASGWSIIVLESNGGKARSGGR